MNFADLHKETTMGLDDIPAFLALCVAYGIYRLFVTYAILAKIAKGLNLKDKKVEFKFIHRCFDLIHYFFSCITGAIAIYGRPYRHCYYFALHCGEFMVQQAEPKDAIVLSYMEKVYYFIFTAYYVVDAFFIWTNNHDVALLYVHHATSLTLIFLSVYIRAGVIGITVLLLHDLVDLPLYFGKIMTYTGHKQLQDIALVIFAIACTWFRMINFPMVIYHSGKNALATVPDHKYFYYFELSILFVLMFCHLCWFDRIAKSAIGIFTSGRDAICDNRSDDATVHYD